jgi:hypothetical protein
MRYNQLFALTVRVKWMPKIVDSITYYITY